MTYLVAVCVYDIICGLIYVGPLVVLILAGSLLDSKYHFVTLLKSAELVEPLQALGGLVLFGLLVLSGYRANIAAETYASGSTGFWNAFTTAGTTVRVQVSCLPVIGSVLRRRSD